MPHFPLPILTPQHSISHPLRYSGSREDPNGQPPPTFRIIIDRFGNWVQEWCSAITEPQSHRFKHRSRDSSGKLFFEHPPLPRLSERVAFKNNSDRATSSNRSFQISHVSTPSAVGAIRKSSSSLQIATPAVSRGLSSLSCSSIRKGISVEPYMGNDVSLTMDKEFDEEEAQLGLKLARARHI
ncbi:hypothetical protein OG21DRAFT_1489948, partial [Imleria badia]